MKKTKKEKEEEAFASLADVCEKYDFSCGHKYQMPFVLIREYAVPDCIGLMVKVKYSISIALLDSDSESEIIVDFNAKMFRRPFDSDFDFIKYFLIYRNDMQFDFMLHNLSANLKRMKFEINSMFEMTETRLKYVLGMERIA